ncbi:thiolase C-terminal domain-containing protein [Sneathiella litorea]|uniref:Thiolase C-terminal domain-containing protein n=1 Tax=Sneathiella litorea TaxID=2606216 RepID=A0A6L8W8N9_9PROT|nr:hypothetical protein [Sneathiella litorea]MZR31496.1 hypothetical protein [Sneathiella litorea]
MSNDAHIIGIGQTPIAKRGGYDGRPELDLAAEAIRAAAADAGLQVDAIDGLVTYAIDLPGEDTYGAVLLQEVLGLPNLRHGSIVYTSGGGGACGAVALAASAVETGRATNVAVFRSVVQSEQRYGRYNPQRPFYNWTAPYGAFAPPVFYALTMRRHMELYGTTSEQLGHVAVTFRNHANRNPSARFFSQPLSMEDYLASRMIAEPYRLFDCCVESEGAAALIVTTEERARDSASRPVRVLAAEQGAGGGFGSGPIGWNNMPIEIYETGGIGDLADRLFARAGVNRENIDVAQIYDAFTGMVIVALEDYGFCARGEGGHFVEGGRIGLGGALPINTSGGHLSEGYMHGANLVLEAVRQIRGTSTAQVTDAELAFVSSVSGLTPTSALILAS